MRKPALPALVATLVLALCAGPALVAPAQAAPSKAPSKARVSIKPSTTAAKAGVALAFRGSVMKTSRGAKIVLQRRTASKRWVTVTSSKVKASKKYVLRTKVRAGATRYRVKVKATKALATSYSRSVVVRGRKTRTTTTPATPSANPVVAQILAETNAFRARNGKPALKLDAAISRVSQAWSQRMADTGTFEHNPAFAEQMPAGWRGVAENIAAGYAASEVVQGWIDSPGHRANLLGSYTHIGIGYVSKPGSPYTRYYTQNFGTYPAR